jgi:Lamin Tail Domain
LAGTTVIDSVSWSKSASGKSRALNIDATDATTNDDESNFCDGLAPYGLGDLGTPGMANPKCNVVPVGMCNDAGTARPIVKPVAGALVITEFIPNPAGTDGDREWFEIKNTGAAAFDLNGLGLDREGDPALPNIVTSPDCKSVAAGAYALFAHKTESAVNGGLPAVDATFSFTMPAASDIRVLDGATVLDKITWTTAPTDASSALDPDKTNVTDNDDALSFCPALTPYGDLMSKGTPKADNPQCP